jgi:hypothetical protein
VLLSLYVPIAVNCTVLVAVTEVLAGVTPMDTRLIPVPLSGALCVEAAMPFVLLIVTSAVSGPLAVGMDEICRLHEDPGPSVAGGIGHPLINWKSPVFGPVREMLLRVIGDPPGFITAIVCETLCVPTICALKIRFGGVNVSVVAAEDAGGLAITMAPGLVVAMFDVTVFAVRLMTSTVAGLC